PKPGVVSRVEVEIGLVGGEDAQVARQEPVQGGEEAAGLDAGDVGVEVGHLAHRVDAGVRAPRAERRYGMPVHALERELELALHRARVALALPASELRAVVGKAEAYVALTPHPRLRPGEAPSSRSRRGRGPCRRGVRAWPCSCARCRTSWLWSAWRRPGSPRAWPRPRAGRT